MADDVDLSVSARPDAYYTGETYWNTFPEAVPILNERATGDPTRDWDDHFPTVVDGRVFERALVLIEPWTVDTDANVRRCAIEATRPRGVWTAHCDALKERPERAELLLEPVRSDASDYVRRSVANWVNDASKSRPDWARALCARWMRESPTPETRWTTHHALRTLRKR